MPQADAQRRLVEALGLMALELTDLVRMADQLEIAIAGLAGGLCASDPRTLADCQVADLLAQRLAGLSGFLSGLAASAPPELRVDVTQAMMTLTLGEQVRRFAGPSLHRDPPAEAGAAVFFADEP